jgi:hypothetical protein
MKNKIDDLRNHLFATLEALQDKDAPMDLDRAKAIADVGRAIIDSAKVEIEFAKVVNDATGEFHGSTFLPAPQQQDGTLAAPPKQLAAVGGRRAR